MAKKIYISRISFHPPLLFKIMVTHRFSTSFSLFNKPEIIDYCNLLINLGFSSPSLRYKSTVLKTDIS